MKILLLLCFSLLGLNASNTPQSGQLLVVTSPSWSSPTASLQPYVYSKGVWRASGKAFKVFIGRNGLGWGKGLHKTPKSAKIFKKEGDGKAPAGIFALTHAFGYAPFNIKYPYKVYQRKHHCVDDRHSKLYNKIIDSSKVKRDYKSHEFMRMNNNYYKYGIVVNHNGINANEKSQKGAGSCIFMHIKAKATAGCTAMKESQMKTVLKWLNPKMNPLLVQGLKQDVKKMMQTIKPMHW